ncbi:CPA_1a_G0053180.mRNA.1.CDS.1 [Saccharomyces cerevisiae]|nr:CPA_1a_G0053180.mRNA.1.CDS.1 [Saccharomyces cerevisiae]CAI7473712.1 CPA_1a_G0053180.mRNA.1.CDS.1 [Saccharomyces cerevisiae]
MQYFRYCILPKSFLLVVGFFLRQEDYQSWMFVNVPIASSATRAKKRNTRMLSLQNRIMEIASLKDGDKEKMTRTRKYLGAFSGMLNI